MELLRQLPAFVGAVLVISAVPGPAVALLIRRCSVGGFRAGVPVVFGLELGLYFWILAAGAGLAALVATSAVAFTVLRVVGAAVLLGLGVQAFRAARRGEYAQLGPASVLPRSGFLTGLLTNLANPKAAVFTFAFYPQFIPHGYPLLPTAAVLGLLQVGMEIAVYLGFAALVGRARSWFTRARIRRRLDALCGTVLVGLGLRVAAESR
ncbi:MAG TPA: LysE family translocator [Jatrophihabitans sp.]|nr:LysE family translocator [Jatrophihabitans sp.]